MINWPNSYIPKKLSNLIVRILFRKTKIGENFKYFKTIDYPKLFRIRPGFWMGPYLWTNWDLAGIDSRIKKVRWIILLRINKNGSRGLLLVNRKESLIGSSLNGMGNLFGNKIGKPKILPGKWKSFWNS